MEQVKTFHSFPAVQVENDASNNQHKVMKNQFKMNELKENGSFC